MHYGFVVGLGCLTNNRLEDGVTPSLIERALWFCTTTPLLSACLWLPVLMAGKRRLHSHTEHCLSLSGVWLTLQITARRRVTLPLQHTHTFLLYLLLLFSKSTWLPSSARHICYYGWLNDRVLVSLCFFSQLPSRWKKRRNWFKLPTFLKSDSITILFKYWITFAERMQIIC